MYSDEEIVKEVLAGEKEFYAVLVDRYQRPVYNLMFRYTRNSEEAADLTQDAFFQAFDRLRTFDTEKRFFPWLYKLAVNLAGDWARKRSLRWSRHHIVRQTAVEAAAAGQHDQIELRDELRQVERALLGLSPQTREILILRYRHSQSVREVAEAFDLSESAVKMRIKRGLESLRSIIGEERGGSGRE